MAETTNVRLTVHPVSLAMLLLQSRMEKIEPGKVPTLEETTKIWDAFSLLEQAFKEEE